MGESNQKLPVLRQEVYAGLCKTWHSLPFKGAKLQLSCLTRYSANDASCGRGKS